MSNTKVKWSHPLSKSSHVLCVQIIFCHFPHRHLVLQVCAREFTYFSWPVFLFLFKTMAPGHARSLCACSQNMLAVSRKVKFPELLSMSGDQVPSFPMSQYVFTNPLPCVQTQTLTKMK